MARIAINGFCIAAGLLIGGVAGFFITWLACNALDPIFNGLASAGWAYTFFTVPAAAILGAILGGLGADRIVRGLIRPSP